MRMVWAGGALYFRSIPLVCASLVEPAPRRFPLKRALWMIDLVMVMVMVMVRVRVRVMVMVRVRVRVTGQDAEPIAQL